MTPRSVRARRRDQKAADPFHSDDLDRRLDKIVERSAKEVAEKVREIVRRPPPHDGRKATLRA